MASVNSVSSTTDTGAATSSSNAAAASPTIQQNQFLQLLVAQLQTQNPLDPMDGTQFVAQLAQFSSLQELTGMHTDLNNIQTYLKPADPTTTNSSASSNSTAQTSPF